MATLEIDDTLLVAFADGELDPITARLVEERVAADPALAERVAMFRQTAQLLHAALSTPDQLDVPPALASNVARIAARHAPGVGRPRLDMSRWSMGRLQRRAWIPLAAAAAIAAFIFGGTDIIRHAPFGGPAGNVTVAHVLDEVADYHSVYAGEREHLVEVPASRRDHLEAWLGARLQYAFKVPDLAAYNLDFQGGRLLAIDRQPVAQLMYTGKDGAAVALCIALTDGDASSSLQRQEGDGMTLFGKGEGHHVFVVVGPVGNPSLRAVAEAMPGLLRQS